MRDNWKVNYCEMPEEINLENKIEDFWNWFVLNEGEFYDINENNRDGKLDLILEKLSVIQSGLAVELSEEFNNKRELVISADGDREIFSMVEKIVTKAPKVNNWIITPFRQRIQEDFSIEYGGILMTPSRMFFSPLIDEGFLDLIIYAEDISGFDEDEILYIGLLVIDGVLGEYDCVTKVRYYDFHELNKVKEKSDLVPLANLPKFVDEFYQRKNGP